jgi:hypothetical protein
VPASDIRALLDRLQQERYAADSRGHAAVENDRRDGAAPSQRSLVIASLLHCPGPRGRDADSSAGRSR